MKVKYKKKRAFTLAEVMITFSVMAIVILASSKIIKSQNNYDLKLMTYAAFTDLQQAIGDLMADGCTTTAVTGDVAKGYCSAQKAIPLIGTNADSRGLCDRLLTEVNTAGTNNCSATAVTNTATSFTAANYATFLNFKLTNGLKIFNLNNTVTSTTPYTIYVDVNGEKGKGVLGTDVVAFYIATDGSVFPYYLASNASASIAATSTDYLSASVRYVDATGKENWLYRGVTYYYAQCYAKGTYPSTTSSSGIACTTPTKAVTCNTSTCEVILDKPGFLYEMSSSK